MSLLARHQLTRPGPVPLQQRNLVILRSAKGFGSETKAPQKPAQKAEEENGDVPSPSTTSPTSSTDKDALALEALEARIKSRRKKAEAAEAKVKVNAPAVDVATGKAPAPAESEAEQSYLAFLSLYFVGVLVAGLALAGSGFLPDAADLWIQDNLYPAYSWIVLGFLGLSSLYGLYKTGKLPGQIQRQ